MNAWLHALFSTKKDDTKQVTASGDVVAYTWFGRPNYAYSEVAQKYWIGVVQDTYYGTTQHIIEYDITNDTYTTTQIGATFQKDDHNQPSILIRKSDGRLICFYGEHNGRVVRYITSTNPYDASSWGTEIDIDPSGNKYSYPSAYQASNGNIFLFIADTILSGDVRRTTYVKSTDGGVTFGGYVMVYNDEISKAYYITCQDGDKVHLLATNGHPGEVPTFNINTYHYYFDMITETFHQSDGTLITIPASYTGLTVVNETSGDDTSWIVDIACKNGMPRILYVLYPNEMLEETLNKYLYFTEWNGTAWVNKKLIAMNLGGYIEDDSTVTQFQYVPASRFDTNNPDIIWMPKQVNRKLELHKVDVSQISKTDAYIEQITFDSTVDNWRPISVPSAVNNVLWLQKNTYTDYIAYNMSLMAKTVLT